MKVFQNKHVYIEGYPELTIDNVELATDNETYYDVNINVRQGEQIVSAATFECEEFDAAYKLAHALAKQYDAEYVECVE